jgi:hypothetical protein
MSTTNRKGVIVAASPPRLRVRWHTDGRVAVQVVPGSWWTITRGGPGNCVIRDAPPDDGWVELFVAELPEHDKHDYDGRPVWVTELEVPLVPLAGAVSVEGEEPTDSDLLRTDALKILAAVNHSDQLQEESNS